MTCLLRFRFLLYCLLFTATTLLAQGWEKDIPAFNFPANISVQGDTSFLFLSTTNQIYKTDINLNEEWVAPIIITPGANSVAYRGIVTTTDHKIASLIAMNLGSPIGFATYQLAYHNQNGQLLSSYNQSITTGLAWTLLSELQTSPDGGVVFLTELSTPNGPSNWDVLKIDGSGQNAWTKSITVTDYNTEPFGCVTNPEGGYVVLGRLPNSDEGFKFIFLDENGNETEVETGDSMNDPGPYLYTSNQNQLLLYSTSSGKVWSYDWSANLQWENSNNSAIGQQAFDFEVTESGKIYIWGRQLNSFGNGDQIFIQQLDGNDGTSICYQEFGGAFDDYARPGTVWNENFLGVGTLTFLNQNSSGQPVLQNIQRLFNIGPDCLTYNTLLQGTVFHDTDLDCAPTPDFPLGGWLVGATGQQNHFAVTDANGAFSMRADTGDYTLTVYPPNTYWDPCLNDIATSVSNQDTAQVNMPIQAVTDCPYLSVDISAPFLRRCMESTYQVAYNNTGTIAAQDAYIEVQLDDDLTFISADIAPTSNIDNLLRFDLGVLDVGATGEFSIQVLVGCDDVELGQTHCTEAHIYPDTICNIDPLWSGASINVNARCEGDSIFFKVQNVGSATTTQALNYVIVEDQIILMEGAVSILEVDQAVEYAVFAGGNTLHFQAEQEPFHPGSNLPSSTIEGCGTGSTVLGQATQFVENDGNPFISIDCQENIGSFDPNDKRAFPKGIGSDFEIEQNTDIEYHIRFQNTGTDTAFQVVVRDELSPSLDLTSLRPGASSHPYSLNIEDDRTLAFTFNNIMLPDSNVNEAASHGFVKFKISQLPDLPFGTQIDNAAAIFFDFNAPVITNNKRLTIAQPLITGIFNPSNDDDELAPVHVFPNPFQTHCQIEIDEVPRSAVTLELYSTTGQLIRQDTHPQPRFTFEANGLTPGFYMYRITQNNRLIGQGKLVIQ